MAYKDLGPNQRAWVRALRSGKYDQTQCTLEDEAGYCCLGVGCKVAAKKGVSVITREYAYISCSPIVFGDTLVVQEDVQLFLGLACPEGSPLFHSDERQEEYFDYIDKFIGIRPTKSPPSLTALNDDYALSFKEIASVIVRFPDLFFKEAK